ncbi:hypothetical protein L9F63_012791 [Diploptera punctata]|uniref:G-protein coupled receptors family 1 profile domain-containing protein n=1 Tax=Diploptera punctata TaxID=6984 RepID=A0AAD8ABL5_DIPPU|nr:hypothetical protein L9F63_012791 [Diploptera punctata]
MSVAPEEFDDEDFDEGSGTVSMISSLFTTTESSLHNLTSVRGAEVQFKLYDILIPVIGGIVLLMNIAVVVSSGLILKGGAHPRTTYLFLGNIAMTDFVTSVAILFGQLYPKEKRNEMLCILQIGMIVSSTLASIWSILLIALDRFFYIVHALRYQQRLTPCRARILIGCTWALGLVVGFMPITGWTGPTNDGKYCWFIKLAPAELVLITGTIGCFPIVAITVLYSIILYYALKKVERLQKADYEASLKEAKQTSGGELRMFRGGRNNADDPQTGKKYSPKKFRAIMVVGLTTGSFILTWVPYLVASVLYVVCMKTAENQDDCKPLSLAIASPLAILGFANSLFNPLIYAWWHKGFRTFVRTKILRRKKVRNQSATGSSKTTSSSTRTNGSSNSRPTSRKISKPLPEGPYIGTTEDTRL